MEKEIVATLLVGTRKLKHFEENVGVVDVDLSQERMDYINKPSLEFQNKHLSPTLELWLGSCRQEDLNKQGIRKNF